MSNNTTTNKQILPILENTTDIFDTLLTYVSLIIVLTGFLGNSISFAIFRFHSEFKSMPSMVYLSFISITDTLSLLVWNLDHFFIPNFSVKLEAANEPICRILTFDQFFSLQASALLLSMLTVDRYFTVIAIPGSFVTKLPFRTLKSAFAWSIGIISVVILLNIHLIVLPRKYDQQIVEVVLFRNETFNLTAHRQIYNMICYEYTTGFKIANFSPNWENFHMIIYNVIPFCVMTIFNGLLIKNVLLTSHLSLHRHKNKTNSTANEVQTIKTQNKKRALTISLVFVTILFLVMTLPSSILFGFFYEFFNQKLGLEFLIMVDYLSFSNSSSLFFVSLLTNVKFRKVVFSKLKNILNRDNNIKKQKSDAYLAHTRKSNAVSS